MRWFLSLAPRKPWGMNATRTSAFLERRGASAEDVTRVDGCSGVDLLTRCARLALDVGHEHSCKRCYGRVKKGATTEYRDACADCVREHFLEAASVDGRPFANGQGGERVLHCIFSSGGLAIMGVGNVCP